MSGSTVLAGIAVSKVGLNYLVPTPWYCCTDLGGMNSVC
jgi:hypothetical protein